MGTDATFGGITRSGSVRQLQLQRKGELRQQASRLCELERRVRGIANWLHNGQPTGVHRRAGTTEGRGLRHDDSRRRCDWQERRTFCQVRTNGIRRRITSRARRQQMETTTGSSPRKATRHRQRKRHPEERTARTTLVPRSVLTDVGAYTATTSHYGAFDMGGNVWEWSETVVGLGRVVRGGGWRSSAVGLQPSNRASYHPSLGYNFLGFRLASIPEPATCSLMLIALVTLGCRRRRG